MGQCFSKKEYTHGRDIERFLDEVRPLDLIVFKGSEFVSNAITAMEQYKTGIGSVSHVEVAISRVWCTKLQVVDDRMCSWGSTLSGPLNDGVNNLETGGSTFGVQVRDLREIVREYLATPGANVGVCRLSHNPTEQLPGESMSDYLDRVAKLRESLNNAYDKFNGQHYNADPLALMAAIFPSLRGLRDLTEEALEAAGFSKSWLFCSQFAAALYIEIGVIDDTTDGRIDGKIPKPEDVLPVDFVGGDADPDGIQVPICQIPPHWIKKI